MENHKFLQTLRIRPFFFLWLSEIFAQLSINIVNFALIIIAFELTNSNTAVSGVVLAFTIPAIILGIPAGVYVDRWNKKEVLLITTILRAVLLFALAFLYGNLLWVYLITFAVAIVTQFFLPAETPIIPLVVKKNLLLSANALFGIGIYGSMLLAYALAGPFLIFLGRTNSFFVLGGLFLIAALFITFIKIPQKKIIEEKTTENIAPSLKEEIRGAISLMVRTREVSDSLFILTLAQILILVLVVIAPGYAKNVLGMPVNTFLLLFITPAVLGMIIGAVIVSIFFHNYPRQRLASIGVFLSGLAILVFPFGSKVTTKPFVNNINVFLPGSIFDLTMLHLMVVIAFVLGIANALTFVSGNTLIQEKTSDEFRGKVYGALNALIGIFSIIPIAVVGGLADIVGVGSVLAGIGIFLLLISSIRLMRKK